MAPQAPQPVAPQAPQPVAQEPEKAEEVAEEAEEAEEAEKAEEAEEKPKRKPAKKEPKKEKKEKKEKKDEPKTTCSICKKSGISNDELLLSHSCSKEALAKKKTAPVFDEQEAPPMPPLLSYREIMAREQAELRRQRQARIVNPIRAHFFGNF